MATMILQRRLNAQKVHNKRRYMARILDTHRKYAVPMAEWSVLGPGEEQAILENAHHHAAVVTTVRTSRTLLPWPSMRCTSCTMSPE